ncbi:MAG TPA: ABC transporter permease [Gammaproteobacteria bacterium]|nr:ABC transporter permease [Gammaproteobacteria bacterium]
MNTIAASDFVFEPAGPMPLGRILRAYLQAARYEFVTALRVPAFTLPFLAMPAALYFLFGIVMAGGSPQAAAPPPEQLATYLISGWCAMAVTGPGIFGFGIGLAMERDAGLLKLRRALPLPAGAALFAKMAMAMLFAALAASSVAIVALAAGKVTIGLGSLSILLAVMILGSVPFCAIGLLIGAYASANAAPAIANLIYLPGLWLSGLFFPLPEALRPWAVIWPVFHLNQTALGAAGIKEFSFVNPTWTGAVLVAITVICAGLALRRLARVG